MIVPRGDFSETDVARHYDELDRFYRDIWGEHIHHGLWVSGKENAGAAVRQLVDLVAVAAEILPDDVVCDVGAGYGAAARQIARDYGAVVTALTISPSQHEYARRKDRDEGNPTYVLGDWLTNDLPSESFDAVYGIECVSHMADPEEFAHQAARVLKAGGRLVVCAWVASEQASTRQTRHLLEPICREGRLAHLSTAQEYVALLERAGVAVTDFQDLSGKVYRTWPIVIRRTFLRLASRPQYFRYLLSTRSTNRIFLITMFRLWIAYRTGVIRYCLFKARKQAGRIVPVNVA